MSLGRAARVAGGESRTCISVRCTSVWLGTGGALQGYNGGLSIALDEFQAMLDMISKLQQLRTDLTKYRKLSPQVLPYKAP